MSTALTNNPELSVPDDGGDNNVWGLELNALSAAWDRLLGGGPTITVVAGAQTLTAEQLQNGRIIFNGTIAADAFVIMPARARTVIFVNTTTGAGRVYIQDSGNTVNRELMRGFAQLFWCGVLVYAAGPPVEVGGGFPDLLAYGSTVGPGIFFASRQHGIGKPAEGYISVYAGDATPLVRFQSPNSASQPTMAFAPDYNTGIGYVTSPNGLFFSAAGSAQWFLRADGFYAGGLGPPGSGCINASQFFRSNVPMPIQRSVSATGLTLGNGAGSSIPHGIGSEPTTVFAKLRCISADLGYATGDSVSGSFASSDQRLMWGSNATQLFYRQGGDLALPLKSTGEATPITVAKWRLELQGVWP